jgi:O-acetylhomoserine/O-acetylserine sulfhydrylase-like pyridoxal-dependent enzyme
MGANDRDTVALWLPKKRLPSSIEESESPIATILMKEGIESLKLHVTAKFESTPKVCEFVSSKEVVDDQ